MQWPLLLATSQVRAQLDQPQSSSSESYSSSDYLTSCSISNQRNLFRIVHPRLIRSKPGFEPLTRSFRCRQLRRNMTDYEVIRSMVLNFRLTELQTLLTFAGQSRAGRKSELQVRSSLFFTLRHFCANLTQVNSTLRVALNKTYPTDIKTILN